MRVLARSLRCVYAFCVATPTLTEANSRTKYHRTTKVYRPPSVPQLRPVIDEARLPPELWLQILHEATRMTPDPLDETQTGLSFLARDPSSECEHEAYRAHIRNKLNLTLVSRRWHALMLRPWGTSVEWVVYSAITHRNINAGPLRAHRHPE